MDRYFHSTTKLLPTSASAPILMSPSFSNKPGKMSKCCALDRRKKCLNYPVTILLLLLALIIYLYWNYHDVFSSKTSSFSTKDLHYSVVIDAGSSGSRAYLYAWPTHSGNPHELLDISPLSGADGSPLYKKATPGLSSFQDHPEDVMKYIKPLLEFAMSHIPSEKIHETPLYILATAGMRLVERTKQEAIIQNLRQGILDNYQFLFPEGNLGVISGKQEGIYQWLAINYVLGKFRHQDHQEMVALDNSGEENHVGHKFEQNSEETAGSNLVFRPRTVGALDMGGASMQIALEITTKLQMQGMTDHEKSAVVEINLGCKDHDKEHTYRVFVTTFLGYGANEALSRHRRNLVLSQIGESMNGEEVSGLTPSQRVEDPCLPLDYSQDVDVSFETDRYNISDTMKELLREKKELFVKGTGDWMKCFESIKDFTKNREKFSSCSSERNCPSEGIKVPPIQFDSSEFYGFSEFWYTMEDVLRMGGPYLYNKYKNSAKDFCETSWPTTWKKYLDGHYPKADAERLQTQCFKSTWLAVALHEGFGFPKTYTHLSAAPETVNGQVVHWTIGALLYRTRFLPLREIESKKEDKIHHGTYHSFLSGGYLYANYVVFFCLALVILAILIYLHRLKRYVNPSTLRKVPSISSLWKSTSTLNSSSRRNLAPTSEQFDPLLSVKVERNSMGSLSPNASSRTTFYL